MIGSLCGLTGPAALRPLLLSRNGAANNIWPKDMLKTTLLAIALWLITLAAGAASVVFGEFGTSLWVMVLLLSWLATLGAPTSIAVLAVTWWWPGGSFTTFLAVATSAALVAQFCGVWLASRLVQHLRRRAKRVDHSA